MLSSLKYDESNKINQGTSLKTRRMPTLWAATSGVGERPMKRNDLGWERGNSNINP